MSHTPILEGNCQKSAAYTRANTVFVVMYSYVDTILLNSTCQNSLRLIHTQEVIDMHEELTDQ
jgi:hypothetical protein